eukprot:gb/GEZN01002158.1/.p1 GENE.gb/GEZN01002158.1/~~gb/GEZN01002158.1/.p1  ORF type:complete len:828 (+),score=57.90 gb/GEZN01002158.1/:326-2485(+)
MSKAKDDSLAFSDQELCMLFWSLAKLRGSHAMEVVIHLASRVSERLKFFTPQGLSNTAWSLGTLGLDRLEIVSRLASLLSKRASMFNAQELANTLWAIAKLPSVEVDVHFVVAFSSAILTHMRSFTSQHLANLLWAIASLSARTQGIKGWELVLNRLFPVLVARASELNHQELSMVAWALATVDSVPRKMESAWSAVLKRAVSIATGMSAQQLATIAWAVAKSDVPSKSVALQIAEVSRAKTSEMIAQDLDHILWFCAKLQLEDPRLVCEATAATLKLLQTPDPASSFGLKHMINIVWSLGKLGAVDDAQSLVVTLDKVLIGSTHKLTPRDLSLLAWSLASLQLSGTQRLWKFMAEQAAGLLAEFNAQECAKLLWSFEKAGVKHPGLASAARECRPISFHFDHIGPTGKDIHLAHIPGGGRHLSPREATGASGATGGALWEDSRVLAEWLTRHLCPGEDRDSLMQQSHQALKGLSDCQKGKVAVELGAGLGLVSIVASLVADLTSVATDGDDMVLDLLRKNCQRNSPSVRVQKLTWGTRGSCQTLGLSRPPSFVFGAGILYGVDCGVWSALVDTLVDLSDSETIIILASGQGAAPGVDKGQGEFFRMARGHFVISEIPRRSLHPDHRRGGCVLHYLKKMRREEQVSHDTAPATTDDLSSGLSDEKKSNVVVNFQGGKLRRQRDVQVLGVSGRKLKKLRASLFSPFGRLNPLTDAGFRLQ